jgi:hypothetical protein
MASLLDVARVRAAEKKRGPVCTIEALKQRHPDRAADIEALVEGCGPDSGIPYSVAAETLIAELKPEVKFKGDVISRHRRHVCSCPVS